MQSESSGNEIFGQQLRKLRIASELTRKALAQRSGISEDAIYLLEGGHRRRPRRDTVRMLADGLGLGVEAREALQAAARPSAARRAGPLRRPARVFLSHTSDMARRRHSRSFVTAAEAAVTRAGHAVVDMAYFAARDTEPGEYSTAMVAQADVYVGIIGLRHGSPVRDRPGVSYTELEFEAATRRGLPRLVFLVKEDSRALPPTEQSEEERARQDAFRRRLRESGMTIATVASPAELELRLYQALVELGAAGHERAPAQERAGHRQPARRRWLPIPRRWRARRARHAPERRSRAPLVALLTTVLVLGAAMITPSLLQAGAAMLALSSMGTVTFVGSQAQPTPERLAMQRVVSAFNPRVHFDSQPSGADDIKAILAAQPLGLSPIDLTDFTYSEMLALQTQGALEDVTPVLRRLQQSRVLPPELLTYGQFGTGRQYYIPWLQATYLLVVNRKAIPYLPEGARLDDLTYDQLIQWGQILAAKTGGPRIGLPAELGPKGGLVTRFLQGYAYPSYTNTTLTGFRSDDAVAMWQMLQRLWAVTDPASTGYASMQEPLKRGPVWIAWDHQARLRDALADPTGQFVAVPAPRGPKGRGYMTALVGLAIPKGARNVAGAEALIDWLTLPLQQTAASAGLNFLPVVQGAKTSGLQAAESRVQERYRSSPDGIETMAPAGLGARGDEFDTVYKETFARIVLHREDIRTVLDDETAKLQTTVNAAGAPCWGPDKPVAGQPCRIA